MPKISDSFMDRTPQDEGMLHWLQGHAEVAFRTADPRADDELVAAAVELVLATPRQFLIWELGTVYRGPGYATGSWKINLDQLAELAPMLLDIARAGQADSLDEWLANLHSGSLPRGTIAEPSGAALLRRRGQDADSWLLSAAAWRRRLHWPRRCRSCDEEFRPERDGIVNCEPCRAARRRGKEGD